MRKEKREMTMWIIIITLFIINLVSILVIKELRQTIESATKIVCGDCTGVQLVAIPE